MSSDKIYYDAVISNLNNVTVQPPILYFNQTRSTPYVNNPSLYDLSIVRWTLDTQTLPIFRPTIKATTTDPNETIYSISLEYQGVIVEKFVIFEPQNETVPIPNAPLYRPNNLQDNGNGYYDIYTYSYWIYLINKAFSDAFDELSSPAENPIVMTIDNTNNICLLNVPVTGYTGDDKVNIYFNTALGNLFSSFPFKIKSNQIDGLNFQLQTDISGDANIVNFPTYNPDYEVVQIYQEYSTVQNWNPILSICVLSSTLPVVQNIEGAPALYLNGILLNGSGNNSNITNLITDFVADDYKPNIIYIPSAEYRRIELIGTQPLSNLDISIFWKDRFGNLNPFRLSSGGSATLKIMFEKKKV